MLSLKTFLTTVRRFNNDPRERKKKLLKKVDEKQTTKERFFTLVKLWHFPVLLDSEVAFHIADVRCILQRMDRVGNVYYSPVLVLTGRRLRVERSEKFG